MLNILDIIFLTLAFMITVTGSLILKYENHMPAFIIKAYKYGSFGYKGSGASFLQMIEMPKSYYRHFYVFSSLFSFVALTKMVLVYFLNFNVGDYIVMILRLLLEVEQPSVCVTAAVTAMSLLTVQCWKRFYETYYLQVFAKSSRMNVNHYLAGIIHYFGCVVAIIGQAPLFTGHKSKVVWTDGYTTIFIVPCILIFLWASYEQFQTNTIFANLRRDKKSKKLVTEDHSIPFGRLFRFVSSPHRMCEVIMYTVLLILVPTKTFFCIYLWVITNQFQTAIQAHEWYKTTFKSYPKERRIIIPNYF